MDEIVYDAAPSPASFSSIKTMPSDVAAERPESVLSGRTWEQVADRR